MPTKKKAQKLNPQADVKEGSIDPKILEKVGDEINKKLIVSSDDTSDSFYRNIVNNLFNEKQISLKTEYLDVRENFAGSKMEFMSKMANMPYLSEFIKIFETKRVSLERKGRKEILMALQERRQEEQADKLNQLKSVLGM